MNRLDALRSEGQLDAKGTFDLDPEEAREKLRKYQLTNPEKYILQFVQAAIILGAPRLDVLVDSDEVELLFDGDSPGSEHLEDLFVHAFGRSTDHRMKAAKHLALGAISAEGIDPSVIEIETPGENGVALRIRGEKSEIYESKSEVNRIYIKERARVEHLKEFISRFPLLDTSFREPVTLEACRYATIPIHLNGRALVHGGELDPAPDRRIEKISTPSERGFLRYDPNSRRPGALTLIQNGVVIEETNLSIGDFRIEAFIETDLLTTNLSFTGFVRNDAWEELIDELLMPAVCRLFLRNTTRALHHANRLLMADLTNGLLESRARLLDRYREPPEILDQTLMHIGDADIWRLSSRRTSLADVLAMFGEGPIYFSTTSYPGVEATDGQGRSIPDYLLIENDGYALGDPRLLAKATGRRMIDVTSQLQERHRRRLVEQTGGLNRLDGVQPRWPYGLHAGFYRKPVTIQEGAFAVSVGFDSNSSLRVAQIFAKIASRDVEKAYRDIPWLNGLTLSLASEDRMNVESLLHEAAHLIALAISRYLEVDRIIVGARETWVPHALSHLMRETLVAEVCETFGRRDDRHLPFAWKAREKHRIFEGIEGSWHTFSELGQRIEFVPESSRTRAVQIAYEAELSGRRGIVWLDHARREIVAAVLGDDALVDVEEELAVAARRIQRERGGLEEDAVLHGTYVFKRSLGGEVTGELGLSVRWTMSPGAIDLVILHDKKRLTTRRLPVPFGQFRAIVEGDLEPTEDLSDIRENEAYLALVERLESVASEIFEEHARERISDEEPLADDEEVVLWRALAETVLGGAFPHRLNWRVFPTDRGMKSYRDLVDRERVYGENATGDAIRIDLPAVPGPRLALLAEIFGDEVEEPRRRIEAKVTRREAGPGPLESLRLALGDLRADVEVKLTNGDDSLHFVSRRFTVGREHDVIEVLEKYPERAAVLMAIWSEPGRAGALV